jgi:hypothetical protein
MVDARNAGIDLITSGAEFLSASHRNMEPDWDAAHVHAAIWTAVPASATAG